MCTWYTLVMFIHQYAVWDQLCYVCIYTYMYLTRYRLRVTKMKINRACSNDTVREFLSLSQVCNSNRKKNLTASHSHTKSCLF